MVVFTMRLLSPVMIYHYRNRNNLWPVRVAVPVPPPADTDIPQQRPETVPDE